MKTALYSEVDVMRTIQSKNIVKLYTTLVSEKNYYIIEELCDCSLYNYIMLQKNRIVPEKQAV